MVSQHVDDERPVLSLSGLWQGLGDPTLEEITALTEDAHKASLTQDGAGVSMILYRPVGLKELGLIAESGYTAFPPRLPEQPIFYPVLNFDYAAQIANEWNTKRPPFAGFVTRFEVADSYVKQFEVQMVGGRIHQELWVPAEELEEFNRHIVGRITVEAAYYGEQFEGERKR